MNSSYRILRTTRDDAALVELVQLLDADLHGRNGEMQAYYSQFNSLAGIDASVIAIAGEQAIGCGCFKRFDDTAAEIKRMFVRPEHRGSGAAAMVLEELERWAAESGYSRAILETGLKQVEAIRFYTKSRYSRVPNYGQYAGLETSVCMAKSLAGG